MTKRTGAKRVSEKNSSRKLAEQAELRRTKGKERLLENRQVIRGAASDLLGWGLGPCGPHRAPRRKPGGTLGSLCGGAYFAYLSGVYAALSVYEEELKSPKNRLS